MFYKNQAVKSARTIFPKVVIKNLREFPFPKVISDKALQKLAALGAEAVSLRKRLCAAKAIQERTVIEREVVATDKNIDRLVYEIYELTDRDITILENEATSEQARTSEEMSA